VNGPTRHIKAKRRGDANLAMPPRINPVPPDRERPLWSVMIPTFDCARFLEETLRSVLAQDPGPGQMEIWVVDDASTADDPAAIVNGIGGARVRFHRNPRNLGAIGNFNRCVELSRGHLVHILHGDDFVAPGFYRHLADMASAYEADALFACRAFIVDENGVLETVTPRVTWLERGGRDAQDLLQDNYLRTPGVVVRREFYERHGGFRPQLVHCADWEMWVRCIVEGGGVVGKQALAYYRASSSNDTAKLARKAENIEDYLRLIRIFQNYPGFDRRQFVERTAAIAYSQWKYFAEAGDVDAVEANRRIYRTAVPFGLQTRKIFSGITRRVQDFFYYYNKVDVINGCGLRK
jgi:glycosyltransferase involved in cell wall biosynthesis